MKLSEQAEDVLVSFEGFSSTRYIDSAGVPTIGFGFTAPVLRGTRWAGIQRSCPTMSKVEAEEILDDVLERFERHVMEYDRHYHWEQHEFDAMVLFAYNLGSIHQLTKRGQRDRDDIAAAMLLYDMADGRELRGLTIRRYAEQQMFVMERYVSRDAAEREMLQKGLIARPRRSIAFNQFEGDDEQLA
jgi:lysozyme